jgi:hypothetical protein
MNGRMAKAPFAPVWLFSGKGGHGLLVFDNICVSSAAPGAQSCKLDVDLHVLDVEILRKTAV